MNGLVTSVDVPKDKDSGKYKINYQEYAPGSNVGKKAEMEVDLIIGADGANSRVAKVKKEVACSRGTGVVVVLWTVVGPPQRELNVSVTPR